MEALGKTENTQQARKSISPTSRIFLDPHGIEKYHLSQQRKNIEKHNVNLENRIKKLLKEDKNSKRLAQLAQKRTEIMSKNHERHLQEIQYKNHLQKQKKQQEDDQRIKNYLQREKRKYMIKKHEDFLHREKCKVVSEIKQNKTIGEIALQKYKDAIERKKAEKIQIMKFHIETKKESRSRSQMVYRSQLRIEYEKRIAEEKENFMKTLMKRKELEAIESGMMQKVSQSMGIESFYKGRSDELLDTSTSRNYEVYEISN